MRKISSAALIVLAFDFALCYIKINTIKQTAIPNKELKNVN